jgi:hypothetical protein
LAPGGRSVLDLDPPPHPAELRLTFNATDGADVDLHARHGAEPTATAYDCESAGQSSYGSCVLRGPASGTWHAALDAGDPARYQLTAVVLAGGPAALDDAYQAEVGTALEVAAADGVLANDGGELTVEAVRRPAHGALTLQADGSFRYEPVADFVGEDSFTYRAIAGELAGGATVRITVVAPAVDDDEGGCAVAAGPGGCGALVLLAGLFARRRRHARR